MLPDPCHTSHIKEGRVCSLIFGVHAHTVIRLLQLGVSLLATPAGGFVLNMDSPESHKTATHFGPTKTTLCDAIASRLQRYITAAQLDAQGSAYVFHAKDDPSTPLSPSAWTNYLKKVFKRFAGVSMAPKELRACAPPLPWTRFSVASTLAPPRPVRCVSVCARLRSVHHIPQVGQPLRGRRPQRGGGDAARLEDAVVSRVRQGQARSHRRCGAAGGGAVRSSLHGGLKSLPPRKPLPPHTQKVSAGARTVGTMCV